MRRILFALTLLSVALPAAAQTTLGVRAGVGIARVDLEDGVYVTPCLPNEVCLGVATDPARSVTASPPTRRTPASPLAGA